MFGTKMFGTKCLEQNVQKKKNLEQNVQKISKNFYLIKCFFVIDISVVDASLDNHRTALCLWTNCLSQPSVCLTLYPYLPYCVPCVYTCVFY